MKARRFVPRARARAPLYRRALARRPRVGRFVPLLAVLGAVAAVAALLVALQEREPNDDEVLSARAGFLISPTPRLVCDKEPGSPRCLQALGRSLLAMRPPQPATDDRVRWGECGDPVATARKRREAALRGSLSVYPTGLATGAAEEAVMCHEVASAAVCDAWADCETELERTAFGRELPRNGGLAGPCPNGFCDPSTRWRPRARTTKLALPES